MSCRILVGVKTLEYEPIRTLCDAGISRVTFLKELLRNAKNILTKESLKLAV